MTHRKQNKTFPQGGSYEEGKVSTHLETRSWVGTGKSFGTSEGSRVTGEQEAKWRDFSTEITADHHFPG